MAVREDGGMRLRTKVMLAAAAAVLIAGAVLGAFLYGVKRASQEAEPLGPQLRTAQALVSVAYHYTIMAATRTSWISTAGRCRLPQRRLLFPMTA